MPFARTRNPISAFHRLHFLPRRIVMILAGIFLAGGLACSEDADRSLDCAAVACTEEFRTIFVSVSDASGARIPLDNFEVLEWPSGEDITPPYTAEDLERFRGENSYPLLTDQRTVEYRNRRVELRFRGFIDGNLVVEGAFTAGADCCHIAVYNGSLELIVD